jgi:hypothetical protein
MARLAHEANRISTLRPEEHVARRRTQLGLALRIAQSELSVPLTDTVEIPNSGDRWSPMNPVRLPPTELIWQTQTIGKHILLRASHWHGP